jgi:phosphate acetyltransferase
MTQRAEAPLYRRPDPSSFAPRDASDVDDTRQHPQYDSLIRACRSLPPIRTAVVHPYDDSSLAATKAAAIGRLIEPVLVGPETRIRELAATLHFDLANVQLVNTPHSHAAAEQAVALVRAGEVGALMKGSLHTDELMAQVVRKEMGIRTARRISHVFIMDVPHAAAAAKSIESTVAGDADILLVPNMEAGNMLVKELTFLANAEAAGIVLGARVPIILTSRADSVRARVASCAIVALYAQAGRPAAYGG